MKVGEGIKKLLKAGFEKQNQVGSHIKFRKGDKVITIVYHSKDSEELSKKSTKQINEIIK